MLSLFFLVVAGPPENVTAEPEGPFSVRLSWTPPSDVDSVVNKSGYYTFYREYDSPPGVWQLAGVPGLDSKNFTIRDLKAYTKYRFRMTLAVRGGNGPASEEKIASTMEGGIDMVFKFNSNRCK